MTKYACFHDKRFWNFDYEITLPRPKIVNVAKPSHVSKASHMQPGSRACFRALEALEFSVLKYAFSHILEILLLSFLTLTSTPNMDKVVPSSWISEIFLCYYNICIFEILILQKMMSFWKYNISAETDQILYDC